MSRSETAADRVSRLATLFPDIDAAVVSAIASSTTDDDLVLSVLYEMAAGISAVPSTPAEEGAELPEDSSPGAASNTGPLLEMLSGVEIDGDRALAKLLQEEENLAAAAAEGNPGDASQRRLVIGSKWAPPSTLPQAEHLTYAGAACVERLQRKYRWADHDILVRVYEAAAGNEKMAETLLIEAHPEVLSIANTGNTGGCQTQENGAGASASVGVRPDGAVAKSQAGGQSPSLKRGSVAEELRKRDVVELASAGAGGGSETEAARISRLRQELHGQITERDVAHALFVRTRKRTHEQSAKAYTEAADATWRELKACLCATEAFRAGTVDLHYLTVEMAIELVEAKISSTPVGNRIRIITGRGNNSVGGRAVLLPRIQRYLTDRGVTHSIGLSGGSINVRV